MAKVYVKNVDRVLKNVQKEVDTKTVLMLNRILKIIKEEVQKIIREEAYDTGVLHNSIETQVFARVTRETMLYFGRVFVNETKAPYYVAIHEGRRPGRIPPPVESIKEWMIRKGIKPTVTLRRASGFGMIRYLPTLDQFAWMMSRSIARKGIKGIKFFDRALRIAAPKIAAEVMKEGFTFKRGK